MVSSTSGARQALRWGDPVDSPEAVAERSPERGSVLVAPVRVAGVPVPAERFVGRLLPGLLDPLAPELREGERALVDRPGRRSGRPGPLGGLCGRFPVRVDHGVDRETDEESQFDPTRRVDPGAERPTPSDRRAKRLRTTEQPQRDGSGWAAEHLHDPSDSSVD